MPKAPYYLGTNMVWYRHGNWNAWFPSHPTKSETLALSTNMLMYKVRQTQARYHGIVPYHIIPVTLLWHRYGMVVWYHHHHTTIHHTIISLPLHCFESCVSVISANSRKTIQKAREPPTTTPINCQHTNIPYHRTFGGQERTAMVLEKGVYKVSESGSDYQFGTKEQDLPTTPEIYLENFR